MIYQSSSSASYPILRNWRNNFYMRPNLSKGGSSTMNSRMLFRKAKYLTCLFTLLILQKLVTNVSGHGDHVGDTLDTGSGFSTLGVVFVILGTLIFIAIVLSGVWLLRRPQLEIKDPHSYSEKVKSFSRNARLYIIHIQGMSLTYGVRAIIYNFYLLYIFRNGVTLFNYEFETVFFIGFLFAMGSLVTGIMSTFNGVFVDKIGKKWSFITGDFIGSITILVIVLFHTPAIVIFCHIARAAVMSIHNIAEAPFIYEQSTEKERVHLFSVSSGMSTMASMSGNLIGGVVPLGFAILLYNHPIVSGIASIRVLQVALFVSVLLWWGSLIPAYFLKENPELTAKAKEFSISARMTFKNVKNWRTVWVFVLSSVFIGLGAGMFAQFFEIFFLLLFNATPAEISIIFAVGAFSIALGNLTSPILAEKFGKVNMIVITRFTSIVFMLLLPFSPTMILAAVFFLFRGFFMNSTGPTESALAMEVVDDEERTTLEALRQAGASIFGALGYLVGGYYMGQDQFVIPFGLASCLYFIATIIFWLHFRNTGLVLESVSDIPIAVGE